MRPNSNAEMFHEERYEVPAPRYFVCRGGECTLKRNCERYALFLDTDKAILRHREVEIYTCTLNNFSQFSRI